MARTALATASRTPTTSKRPALVAAARRIELSERDAVRGLIRSVEGWQEQAWEMFDALGIIKYPIWFSGNAMSKLRIFAAVRDPADPARDPVEVTAAAAEGLIALDVANAATREMARLRGEWGGHDEILREWEINWSVAGECYLVGWGARQETDADGVTTEIPERWEIRSVSEVDARDPTAVKIKDTPGAGEGRPLDKNLDTIIRLWIRHPRWSGLPDSYMRGVMIDCRAALSLSNQVIAEANSRLGAGALLAPDELTAYDVTADGADGDDSTLAAPGQGLQSLLDKAMTEPISDPSSAAAVAPFVIVGPREALDAMRRLDLSRTPDEGLDERIEKRVRMIARGLNLPVETVEGMENTTFANAEQIDQDVFDDHFQPRAVMMVSALAQGFLLPNLLDAGIAPDQLANVTVWFDPSMLVARPDPAEAAAEAHDKFVISDEAYRRYKGLKETDAPTPEEVATRVGMRRGILTADLTAALLELLAKQAGITLPEPPEQLPTGGGQVAASAARPRHASMLGRELLDIDRDLRSRLVVAANDTMDRAITVAGNRVKNALRATYPALRTTPAPEAAMRVGRQALTAANVNPEELLDGAFDEFAAVFKAWGTDAGAAATRAVYKAVGGLSASRRRELEVRLASGLDEATDWLVAALRSVAADALFTGPAVAQAAGEVTAGRVMPGLIREALSYAGGRTALTVDPSGSAGITLRPGDVPPGGIATGEAMRQAITDGGGSVERFRWVYGPYPRQHPFAPHADLDGVEFDNFDDPVLAVSGGWPERAFYAPGDHAGCACDFEMFIAVPDTAAE